MNGRLGILAKIDSLEDNHCKKCQRKPHFNETNQHCVKECDIGKQLRELGNQLQGIKKERIPKMTKPVLDFEQYKLLKAKGKSTKEIAKEYGIKEGTLYSKVYLWKKENGEKETDYQEVKQEVKKIAAVDQNVVKALEIKIAELEEQAKDYPNVVARAKELENTNVSLRDELSKMGELINENSKTLSELVEQLEQQKAENEGLHEQVAEWREKAQLYASENARLDGGYKSIRNVVDEQNDLNQALKMVLKKVL